MRAHKIQPKDGAPIHVSRNRHSIQIGRASKSERINIVSIPCDDIPELTNLLIDLLETEQDN